MLPSERIIDPPKNAPMNISILRDAGLSVIARQLSNEPLPNLLRKLAQSDMHGDNRRSLIERL